MNDRVISNVDRSLADMAAAAQSAASLVTSLEAGVAVTPVGTWLERFSVEGEQKSSTLHFTPNGRVFILAGPPHGGAGAGTWAATGENRFSYRVAERILDGAGNFIGWVDIDHVAVQSGSTFTSTGTSTIYDGNDQLITQVSMAGEGTQVLSSAAAPILVLPTHNGGKS